MQVKLLRVLQERKFRRSAAPKRSRSTSASSRRPTATWRRWWRTGEFREDLFYRINVVPLKVPPLRERQDDIPLLAEHFLEQFAAQMKKAVTGISGAAMRSLRSYAWPGNVRELENAIERAVALERTPPCCPTACPKRCARPGRQPRRWPPRRLEDRTLTGGFDLEQHVQGIEREYIMEALRRANGVKRAPRSSSG